METVLGVCECFALSWYPVPVPLIKTLSTASLSLTSSHWVHVSLAVVLSSQARMGSTPNIKREKENDDLTGGFGLEKRSLP